MGAPAVVLGDKVMGMCAGHQIPAAAGAPAPGPPMPLQAPLLQGLATTVTIGGKPAAVQGSSGYNTPPHVGLHASDPKVVPTTQDARVLTGSSTVTFDGKPAAYTGCPVMGCLAAGAQVTGTGTTVLVAQ